jgi:hypothetical protein
MVNKQSSSQSYQVNQYSLLNSNDIKLLAIRRTNLVGRIGLYSLTVFMISCPLAIVAACIWLFASWAQYGWFLILFRTLVALTLVSISMLFFILFILYRFFVPEREFHYLDLNRAKVHVCLTAYNDEICIGDAVKEFKNNPLVDKVIVVENNSKDNSYQVAVECGADIVVTERVQGYGACCMRALAEAAEGLDNDDIIVLCEGDMTFSGNDINKFIAYMENCDLVLGTRATQELRATKTQMDWLINPGNQIVAKMIQTRFWGTRLTDVGCTYRAIRVGAYYRLASRLNVKGNHFSPHMFIEALKMRMRVIEIPVVFRSRAGESKGVGSNKIKAAKVAFRMLKILYTA